MWQSTQGRVSTDLNVTGPRGLQHFMCQCSHEQPKAAVNNHLFSAKVYNPLAIGKGGESEVEGLQLFCWKVHCISNL